MLMNRLVQPGEQALTFRLLDHQGLSVGLDDVVTAHAGVVLVFFSSDWLKGDLELLRAYGRAYADFQAKNIALLAVSGINWENLHYLAKRLQAPFPLIFDPCCRYSGKYGAMWIPKYVTGRAVVVLNPQGRVLFSRKGAVPPSEVLAEGFSSES
jgi:peroxiredoxin